MISLEEFPVFFLALFILYRSCPLKLHLNINFEKNLFLFDAISPSNFERVLLNNCPNKSSTPIYPVLSRIYVVS